MALTALLVDDQSQFLQLARDLLKNDPRIAVVGEAKGGEEALALVKSLKPDVVILDVHMPGMHGFEVAQALLNANPGLRIVMVSSLDVPEYREISHAVGAAGFISKKEFSKEALLKMLQHG